MPAIGASTTAGSTASRPSCNGRIAVAGSSVLVTPPRVGGGTFRAESPGARPGFLYRKPLQQPAAVLGKTDGLGAVAGAGLADRGRQVVADRPPRQVPRPAHRGA